MRVTMFRTTAIATSLAAVASVVGVQVASAAPTVDPTTPIGYSVSNGVADTAHPLDGTKLRADVGSSSTAPSPGTVADSRSVIGPDDRGQINDTTAFPYRAFGQEVFTQGGQGYTCTGWLVAADTAVTAGHCVHDESTGGIVKNFTISPGRNGKSNPWGTVSVKQIWTDKNYGTRAGHDWAVIKRTRPIGATVGWIGIKKTNGLTLTGTTQTVTGYPGDKPSGTEWSATGPIERETGNNLYYSIDTFGGQSGSAVYQNGRAVGIHVTGVGGSFDHKNGATRITDDLYNTIVNLGKR